MPTYVYRCEQCETTFEAVRKYSDPPLELCPAGHEKVARVFTPPVGIHFKGSGWYSTDSKGSSTGGTTPKAKESAPKSESSESSESSAPKSESKESPKSEGSATGEAA